MYVVVMRAYAGVCAVIFVLLVSACRGKGSTSVQSPAHSPAPVLGFAVPVGLLPVNVVGSYGGGTAFAKRAGAGKHPLPAGLGVPVEGSSPERKAWACMVLVYGSGASVQYEGMGNCGVGKEPPDVKSAPCEIALPKKEPTQTHGVVGMGWCAPIAANKGKRKL